MAEVNQVDTELEEATGATLKTGKRRLSRKELNKQLAVAHRAENKEQALMEIAARNGYKKTWAHAILRVWNTRPLNA